MVSGSNRCRSGAATATAATSGASAGGAAVASAASGGGGDAAADHHRSGSAVGGKNDRVVTGRRRQFASAAAASGWRIGGGDGQVVGGASADRAACLERGGRFHSCDVPADRGLQQLLHPVRVLNSTVLYSIQFVKFVTNVCCACNSMYADVVHDCHWNRWSFRKAGLRHLLRSHAVAATKEFHPGNGKAVRVFWPPRCFGPPPPRVRAVGALLRTIGDGSMPRSALDAPGRRTSRTRRSARHWPRCPRRRGASPDGPGA